MAEKQDLSHVPEGNTNMGYSPPPAYAGGQQPAAQYQPPAPYTAAPYTPVQYTGVPHPGQQYTVPPQPGMQYSQQSASTVVVQQPMHSTVFATTVPDNMGLAIFACLCCFWPLGLVAICRASESQNALARGDIQAATKNSRDARQFSLISIGVGILLLVVTIILAVAIPIGMYNSAVSRRYD